jgi:hypothetical protein
VKDCAKAIQMPNYSLVDYRSLINKMKRALEGVRINRNSKDTNDQTGKPT